MIRQGGSSVLQQDRKDWLFWGNLVVYLPAPAAKI
jgi:hypothetical protein